MKKLEENKYWIWLNSLKTIGSIKKQKLLKKLKSPERIFYSNQEEIGDIKGIGKKSIKEIFDPILKERIEYEIKYMQENHIKFISIEDEEYPQKLKEIYDYPIGIYIKGNEKILKNHSIAIIGCRDYSEYGKKCAEYFSYNLAREGKIIISGLAKGIDSFAHWGAVKAKEKTIAVVGNGLDTVYPKENQKLLEEILKNDGAIISEYPVGVKPEKNNFPARNRIISGISEGVLVIEAKKKSGTLITVDFALEQGRDVYVVPGNINSINSTGTNDLIKQGATLVSNYKEIE